MRIFNKLDIDLRLVSQLKATFISKDKGSIPQVPLNVFKDASKSIFKHLRQIEEIVAKINEVIQTET